MDYYDKIKKNKVLTLNSVFNCFYSKYANFRKRISKIIPVPERIKQHEQLKSYESLYKLDDKVKLFYNGHISFLYIIPKEKLDKFLKEYKNFSQSNKTHFFHTDTEGRINKIIEDFQERNSTYISRNLGPTYITNNKVSKKIQSVDASIITLSTGFALINIELNLSKETLQEINKLLGANVETEVEYSLYKSDGRYHVVASCISDSAKRRENTDRYITNLKYEIHKSICDMFAIESSVFEFPPTIDEYVTNVELEKVNQNGFITSNYFRYHEYDGVYEIETNPSENINTHKIILRFDDKLKSNNCSILIESENQECKTCDNFDIYSLKKYVLSYYLLNEYSKYIFNKHKFANKARDMHDRRLYSNYISSIKNINVIKDVFIGVESTYDLLIENKMSKNIKECISRYKKLELADEKADEYIANIINIRNIKTSSKLAKASIIIAIISLFLQSEEVRKTIDNIASTASHLVTKFIDIIK